MSALPEFQPFALAVPPAEWFIERVPVSSSFGSHIERWKEMQRAGWDLQVLLVRDESHVVALGCRYQLEVRLRPDTPEHSLRLMQRLGAHVVLDEHAPRECDCGCRSVP